MQKVIYSSYMISTMILRVILTSYNVFLYFGLFQLTIRVCSDSKELCV